MHESMRTPRRPLNSLGEAELCPGAATLAKINASLR
jgi:2-oxoglutarate ferredoxin oxidoreductase subunit beta